MKSILIFKCVSQTAHKIIERTSCSLISQIELIWHNSFFHVSRSLCSDEAIYILQTLGLQMVSLVIWRIKELILRFNFHHQKHSHISGLSSLYGCPSPVSCTLLGIVLSTTGIFFSIFNTASTEEEGQSLEGKEQHLAHLKC